MQTRLKDIFERERPFFYVVPAFVWQVLFFYMPLIFMIIMSFLSFCPSLNMQIFSWDHYKPFLNGMYLLIMLKSLILACVNGIICFLAGYPIAFFVAFRAGRLKNLFLFLLILPFWTNFLLHVYAWFFVLDNQGIINYFLRALGLINQPLYLLNSLFGIILLMGYCYLPFMVLPIYSALERFDKTLIEASRDLGASSFETWYHIVLPLSMSGVVSGFLLVFVPSFGEFAIPGLMGGDKYLFVGPVIAQYALGHKTMPMSTSFTVMCLISILMLVSLGLLVNRLFFKRYRVKDE